MSTLSFGCCRCRGLLDSSADVKPTFLFLLPHLPFLPQHRCLIITGPLIALCVMHSPPMLGWVELSCVWYCSMDQSLCCSFIGVYRCTPRGLPEGAWVDWVSQGSRSFGFRGTVSHDSLCGVECCCFCEGCVSGAFFLGSAFQEQGVCEDRGRASAEDNRLTKLWLSVGQLEHESAHHVLFSLSLSLSFPSFLLFLPSLSFFLSLSISICFISMTNTVILPKQHT